MTNYIIEGTVSEVSVDESNNISFKMCGTEGYSIKYGKEKYNIFCPKQLEEDMKNDKKIHLPGIIVSQDYQFSTSNKNIGLIIRNCGLNRKLKICTTFSETENLSKIFADKNLPIKVESMILLSE